MINVIISIILGFILGIIAGIVPGLHPNLVGILFVSTFLDRNSIFVLISMLVSASFFEFIRSILLFVPDEGHVLAMHPIFMFVNEGKGLVALKLAILGLFVSIMLAVIFSPVLLFIVPPIFIAVKNYVPFILLGIAIFLISKDEKPVNALIIFALSGVLGYFGLKILKQPFLILLTGFFGFPILFKLHKNVTKQIKSYEYKIQGESILRGVLSAFISSLMLTFVPAVGPAQASVFTRGLLSRKEDFILSIGSIAGFDIVFSLLLMFWVGKARIGVIEIAGKYFNFDIKLLIICLLIVLAVGGFSYFVVLRIGKFLILNMGRIDYKIISIGVICCVTIASFLFDSFLGIFFLFLATAIGMLANKLRTRMTHCMGSLMIPTILLYL